MHPLSCIADDGTSPLFYHSRTDSATRERKGPQSFLRLRFMDLAYIIEPYLITREVKRDRYCCHCPYSRAALTHRAHRYPGDEKIGCPLYAWTGDCWPGHQSFGIATIVEYSRHWLYATPKAPIIHI